LADCQRAVTLAMRAVALTEEKDADILQTLGVALCRAGRDEDAVLALEKADALRTRGSNRRSAIDHAFLAISHQHMKESTEALAGL
jgi:Flp pilus assembly protein TadD